MQRRSGEHDRHHGHRGALGAAVDCAAAAAAKVATTGAFGKTVGHEAEVRALCETGLDRAVAKLRARIAEQNWEVIRLETGSATMVDADGDHTAEQLGEGTWTAKLDAGQGLRPVPATFTGAAQ